MLRSGLNKAKQIETKVFSVLANDADETCAIGYQLGQRLPAGSIVCLYGDLAAGKTTFVKGLVAAINGFPEETVNSPTYTYLNIYSGALSVYHFDLYRLHHAEEFFAMGFEEYLFAGGITCLEWAEKVKDFLPLEVISVFISHEGEGKRRIIIQEEL